MYSIFKLRFSSVAMVIVIWQIRVSVLGLKVLWDFCVFWSSIPRRWSLKMCNMRSLTAKGIAYWLQNCYLFKTYVFERGLCESYSLLDRQLIFQSYSTGYAHPCEDQEFITTLCLQQAQRHKGCPSCTPGREAVKEVRLQLTNRAALFARANLPQQINTQTAFSPCEARLRRANTDGRVCRAMAAGLCWPREDSLPWDLGLPFLSWSHTSQTCRSLCPTAHLQPTAIPFPLTVKLSITPTGVP